MNIKQKEQRWEKTTPASDELEKFLLHNEENNTSDCGVGWMVGIGFGAVSSILTEYQSGVV